MLLTWLGLAGIGLAAGVLGALLGLGGGIFLVPALTLVFDMPIRAAVGTSLIGIIATSAGVASVSRPGRGADIPLALRLELSSTIGALIGSLSAGFVSQRILALVFALIVLVTAGYTLLKMRRRPGPASERAVDALFSTDYRPVNWPAGLGATGVAGILSGLTGTGGGFIKVPVMHSLMEVPLGIATASSNFMVGITAAASAMIYYTRGDISPLVAVPTAVGVFTGAVLGARLAARAKVTTLRVLLVILLLLIAAQMGYQGIQGG
jgi:uncharacterized protein